MKLGNNKKAISMRPGGGEAKADAYVEAITEVLPDLAVEMAALALERIGKGIVPPGALNDFGARLLAMAAGVLMADFMLQPATDQKDRMIGAALLQNDIGAVASFIVNVSPMWGMAPVAGIMTGVTFGAQMRCENIILEGEKP
jgi:hypothetical protein